jgi:hypothetical protein
MIWAAATGGWGATGGPDARVTLAQISGGGSRRAVMQTMFDGAVALLHGEMGAAGDLFADALRQADRQASDVIVTKLAGLIGQWTADSVMARDRFARVVAQRRAEGLELLHQLGYEQDEISYLALQAWNAALLGNESERRERAESATQRGLATGVGWATREAHLALGRLELGLGNAREAIEHLEQMDPGPFPPTMVLATPEFIDAALRLAEPERARLSLERFEAWAPVSRTR